MLESTNGSVKEVNDLGVFRVALTIACNVKGRGACSVLRELREGKRGHSSREVDMLTSCAQKASLGAPWLIQYLFTKQFI